MGIKGLWEIVSPAGIRVDPRVLEGRIIAVDSSIWVAQFIKALKDAQGNPIPGAHVFGFFRRLCKLLYYGIRPVVVFDGPPPALKKAVLLKRQQMQKKQEFEIKRVAERLLMNRMKQVMYKKIKEQDEGKKEDGSEHVSSQAIAQSEAPEVALSPTSGSSAQRSEHFFDGHDDDDEGLVNAELKRARREAYYGGIPSEFTGFLSGRRRLDDISINPTGLQNILSMPTLHQRLSDSDAPSGSSTAWKKKVFRESDDFKEYRTTDEQGHTHTIQLPLDSSIDPEVFAQLSPKIQYSILIQLRDAWVNESRHQVLQAKDDAETLSNVQIEAFVRHVQTAKVASGQ